MLTGGKLDGSIANYNMLFTPLVFNDLKEVSWINYVHTMLKPLHFLETFATNNKMSIAEVINSACCIVTH